MRRVPSSSYCWIPVVHLIEGLALHRVVLRPTFYPHCQRASSSVPLGVQREIDAAIYRSTSKVKSASQSSGHGVRQPSEPPVSSSLSFVEGHIRLFCYPETMQQHCQLSRNGNDRLLPGVLSASLGQVEPHRLSALSLPNRPRMKLAHSVSSRRKYSLPAFVMLSCGSRSPD